MGINFSAREVTKKKLCNMIYHFIQYFVYFILVEIESMFLYEG